MGNLNPSFILDVVVIVFLFTSLIIGYIRGFTTRFVSFTLSIAAFVLAFMLSKPISLLFTFKLHLSDTKLNELLINFYPLIYRIIAFIILFIVLIILKVIITFIFRNTIKRIIDTLAFSRFLDSILGSALSLVQGLMVTFIALCIMMMPFIKNGSTTVQQSFMGSHILKLVPSVSEQLTTFSNSYLLAKDFDFSSFSLDKLDKNSVSALKSWVKQAQDMGIITSNDVARIAENYRDEIVNVQDVKVSQDTKQQIDELLEIPGIPQDIKAIIQNKIIVE